MSAPASANRRSAGSGRFDYCRFIELDYVPMETGYMVSMRPTKGYASTKSPSKGYVLAKSPDRHTGRSANTPSTPSSRRTPAPPSNRDPYGNTSHSGSSNSSSCKGSDCSPTKARHRQYTSCTDNHGIRPPPPEQYLTPLQQKEVCIRHLRAKLKETVDRLQDRDCEVVDLRLQLSKMQEDWVEEECHRIEAQLALKEARREIQQLKQAVDTIRTSLSHAGAVAADNDDSGGIQKYFQDINAQNHKLESLLLNMELAQSSAARQGKGPPGRRSRAGGSAPASVSGESPCGAGGRASSCSCDSSPARSLPRSSTYTRLSEQAELRGDRAGIRDGGFVCLGEGGTVPSRAHLLLEAAFLSEETASLLSSYTHTLPYSSTHEKLAPHCCSLGGAGGSASHPCLSHHLYLHHLRETAIQTESCPSDLDTIAEQRTFRSQACSPSSAWLSDEGEDQLDSVAETAAAELSLEGGHAGEEKQESKGREKPRLLGDAWAEADFEASDVFEAKRLDWIEVGGAGSDSGAVREAPDRKRTDLAESGFPGAARRHGISMEEGGEQRELGFPAEEAPSAVRSSAVLSPGGVRPPCTSQPRRSTSSEEVTVVDLGDEDDSDRVEERWAKLEGGSSASARGSSASAPGPSAIQKSYWSRHFLIDLLAVAVPVVPTVAWLCRGPARAGQPMYHLGSLLRGCCTVALHSLRRGGGLRHYPAGGGDLGGTQI